MDGKVPRLIHVAKFRIRPNLAYWMIFLSPRLSPLESSAEIRFSRRSMAVYTPLPARWKDAPLGLSLLPD